MKVSVGYRLQLSLFVPFLVEVYYVQNLFIFVINKYGSRECWGVANVNIKCIQFDVDSKEILKISSDFISTYVGLISLSQDRWHLVL